MRSGDVGREEGDGEVGAPLRVDFAEDGSAAAEGEREGSVAVEGVGDDEVGDMGEDAGGDVCEGLVGDGEGGFEVGVGYG